MAPPFADSHIRMPIPFGHRLTLANRFIQRLESSCSIWRMSLANHFIASVVTLSSISRRKTCDRMQRDGALFIGVSHSPLLLNDFHFSLRGRTCTSPPTKSVWLA
mmetsp:Transcript_42068/g.88302  ORF Transcript_42068/g.88302 Transcript_42068/m.88302 type:complete len:105 (+) Transcript_42068:223-537(+)|eukprot:CAMPEP_0183714056 /NCGR_PEP_ID=MMETSP0737-20130205/8742_1 /TAXON_ID=385413 /ORGANISM="Thalassiosira miniscula, Strain CCMP1093" /LENGTH=104 /DNA_ID=CAMNT_0025942961 /DNA_START=161 /DNA_END=475 /DNA_ORIENTATION=+